jgi:hypothetical protein
MIPFSFTGGYEDLPRTAVEMVELALRHKREGRPPTVLGALQAVVHPTYQNRGLSAVVLQTMAGRATHYGFTSLFAPIRPSRKDRTPMTSFAQYIQATRSDGLPLDPWQRVHVKLGATPAGIVDRWLSVRATTGEWGWWTDRQFTASGLYPIEGGLVPLKIDMDRNLGLYEEPHLWMHYRIAQ